MSYGDFFSVFVEWSFYGFAVGSVLWLVGWWIGSCMEFAREHLQ
jgi:hypothetical protein